MRFDWSDEQEQFREELRAFVEAAREEHPSLDFRQVASRSHLEFSRWFVRELAARGWLAPHWPIEYGGQADIWRHIILNEELWSRGEPRGPQYMNVNWVAPLIMAAGTEEQKAHHLEKIRRGEVIWCQGFSEPEAGSDLVSLRTRAVRDGDDYVVNGQKIWTSYAHVADYCFMLVRSDLSAAPQDGISVLLVPMDLPGIEVRMIEALAGEHQFHELFLTDVRVPATALLGEEHRGWELVRQLLAYERVGSPRYAAAEVELERLASWARDRSLLSDRDVRHELGTALSACQQARVLTYRALDERAKGVPAGGNAYIARAAMVRADRAVSAAAFAIMGADGLVAESVAERQQTSAMIAGVASGAYEIQLNLIARLCLRLPKD